MTPDAPQPPRIPDYELLKPIGRGSYGEVWLARSVTGVFRVIKIVRRDRFEDASPFLRELQGISRYQAAVSGRPRQLALLHVGLNEDAGYFYYVMEPADDAETGSAIDPERYVPLTLRELFRRRGRLPAAECVQIALELARGLAVLHDENLIHRDIKPSNIIFVQGVPKLADVGLVAVSDASLTYVGTLGYLPHEGPGTIAADIFSLGKVLYEIATGLDRMEFPLVPAELAEGPEAPIHRELNTIALKACHPNPAERHPTASAFARDLELVQAGGSVAFYEGLRKRFRTYSLLGGTLIALAAIVIGLMFWRAGVLGRAREQTRRALYRSDLAVAQLAKASGDLGRARAALQRQIPEPGETDLRGLEWAILEREVRGEGLPLDPLPSPPAAVRAIATAPDGRWAAASFADNRVGIWELPSRRLVRVLTNALVLGGFLPDGRLVIDEPARALRLELPTTNAPTRIETGERLSQLLPDGRALLVSPSGDFVFKTISLDPIELHHEFNLSAHWPGPAVSANQLSPTGQFMAFGLLLEEGARRSRWITAFDFENRTELWRNTAPSRILWIRTSPDNHHFAANLGGLTPLLMRYNQAEYSTPLRGHNARVEDADFSPNGLYIATASSDQTVRIWQVSDGSSIATLQGLGRSARAVKWVPDSTGTIAGDDQGNLRVFSIPSPTTSHTRAGFFADVAGDFLFDTSGLSIAVTVDTNTIQLVSSETLEVRSTYQGVFQPIAFQSNGQYLISFTSDWGMRKTSTESGHSEVLKRLIPTNYTAYAWATSPNQKLTALSGENGGLITIDLSSHTAKQTSQQNGSTIWSLAFSADSAQLWTGDASGAVILRDAVSGLPVSIIAEADGEVQALAVSPDGKWIAAALFDDASVRIWDREHNCWIQALLVHRRFVQTLLFTQKGDRLISGGTDGRIVIWRVPEFEQVSSFDVEQPTTPTGDEGVFVLRLDAENRILAALMEDGRLRVWRTDPSQLPSAALNME